jgi:hypothetical protein
MAAPMYPNPQNPIPVPVSSWKVDPSDRGSSAWRVKKSRGIMMVLSVVQLITVGRSDSIVKTISILACLFYAGCAATVLKKPVEIITAAAAVLALTLAINTFLFVLLMTTAGGLGSIAPIVLAPIALLGLALPGMMLRDLIKARSAAVELTRQY